MRFFVPLLAAVFWNAHKAAGQNLSMHPKSVVAVDNLGESKPEDPPGDIYDRFKNLEKEHEPTDHNPHADALEKMVQENLADDTAACLNQFDPEILNELGMTVDDAIAVCQSAVLGSVEPDTAPAPKKISAPK
ncbi:MAG: hypothetical protein AAGI66_02075 [Cyanobacteria bacterium P01_H01_bin.74]